MSHAMLIIKAFDHHSIKFNLDNPKNVLIFKDFLRIFIV